MADKNFIINYLSFKESLLFEKTPTFKLRNVCRMKEILLC